MKVGARKCPPELSKILDRSVAIHDTEFEGCLLGKKRGGCVHRSCSNLLRTISRATPRALIDVTGHGNRAIGRLVGFLHLPFGSERSPAHLDG